MQRLALNSKKWSNIDPNTSRRIVMQKFKNLAIALHNDEDGATATEYIILLVLIAVFFTLYIC